MDSKRRSGAQRRNYKERAQPKEREKWGILEKHKDYSLRAKDYNEKKRRTKILKEKAAERNPDEFHFAMMSSKTDGRGQKVADRGNKVLSHDAAKLFKTQDAGYLRTMAQKTRLVRERLEQQYLLEQDANSQTTFKILEKNSGVNGSSRVVFVDTKEDQEMYDANSPLPHERQSSGKELRLEVEDNSDEWISDNEVEQPRSSTKKSAVSSETQLREARALRKKRAREQEARKAKLTALKQREDALNAAERELDVQRGRMNNSVGGVTKAGVKFKIRERKR